MQIYTYKKYNAVDNKKISNTFKKISLIATNARIINISKKISLIATNARIINISKK